MDLKVRAVFIQEFYEIMGRFQAEVELPEGSTVRDLIDYIDREIKSGFRSLVLDDKGGVKYPVEIAVNGRRIDFLDGLDTKLRDGDKVLFSPRALFVV
ncbi:MoaD/ThiS family protein [Pyrodictium abyssi]|uniref:MoaD family protein n=1 Tax=Pyrodictium abyssi TaxID=54256 RepID=A0ABN6ZQ06_9CREN|nr:MoaD family protein [Pyrodictium abyssi]